MKKNTATLITLTALTLFAGLAVILLLCEPVADSVSDFLFILILTRAAGFALLACAFGVLRYGFRHGYLDDLRELINEEERP